MVPSDVFVGPMAIAFVRSAANPASTSNRSSVDGVPELAFSSTNCGTPRLLPQPTAPKSHLPPIPPRYIAVRYAGYLYILAPLYL